MPSSFTLPQDYINATVQVFLKTAVPARAPNGETAVTFPSFIGVLKADLDGALLVTLESGNEVFFPKDNVQQIMRASDLAVASAPMLDLLRANERKLKT